jgi:MYXO-CTERM domain-containing protein
MTRKFMGVVLAATALFVACLFGRDAAAAGNFKLKSTEAQEVSGAWHIFVTIELPKAPTIGHVPLRFLFTKTAVYERALVDNRDDPVTNRMSLQNQTPSIESLDVDFADGSGKIFKGTRFDFGLTRTRGYEAGEYIVQVRTADGVDIGGKAQLTLKGDNPVVDRRSITFNAKEGNIKKVDTGIDGGLVAKNNNDDVAHAGVNTGDITGTGTAKPFIPDDAYKPTPEEQGLKEHPKGCGCSVPGMATGPGLALAGAFLGLVVALVRRRRRS